jgi:hypothetical protein
MFYVEDHNIDEDLGRYQSKQKERQLGRNTNLCTCFLQIVFCPSPSDHCKTFCLKSALERLKLTILVKFPFYEMKVQSLQFEKSDLIEKRAAINCCIYRAFLRKKRAIKIYMSKINKRKVKRFFFL